MLFAGTNFLIAGIKLLSDVAYFLYAGLKYQNDVGNFGLSGLKSEIEKGSFALSGRYSLFDVVQLLNDVVGLQLLYFFKL